MMAPNPFITNGYNEEKYIKILEYIRANKRPENDDIEAKFGKDGLWTLSIFRSRCSDVRQKEGLAAMRNKRDEIIDTLESEISSGKQKTLDEILWKTKIQDVIITIVSIVAAIVLLLVGGAAIFLIPPIWIIVFLLIYISKRK